MSEHDVPAHVALASPIAAILADDAFSIDALETAMRQREQVEIAPTHHFADGIYAREITIPAGTLLTGKIHRTRHLNIVSQGDITVWSPGEPARRIQAPFAFVAEPGTRRVGFAHEDTVWTTIHATSETDLEKLEAQLIEPHEPHDIPYLPMQEEDVCLG
jgi:hypothetical protein